MGDTSNRNLIYLYTPKGPYDGYMQRRAYVAVPLFLLSTAFAAWSQEIAPNVSGTSVQGSAVDLNEFKGEKNVLLVFYRMHT